MATDDEKECLAIIRRAGVFSVGLVPDRKRYFEADAKLPAHRNVLLPLLSAARECWVYDIRRGSPIFRIAADILVPSKGKFAVNLAGDPVTGRERFWNVQGGERGTIVILVPREQFDARRIFAHCYGAWVFTNFLTAHTPAAARFARDKAATEDVLRFAFLETMELSGWMFSYIPQRRSAYSDWPKKLSTVGNVSTAAHQLS